jgi:hypothetical protein
MFLLQPRLRWVGPMNNINILKWNRKEKQEYFKVMFIHGISELVRQL